MANAVWSNLVDFEHGEKLMFTQLQESVAFAAIHFLQIKHILVKPYRCLYVAHFYSDMIASKNLHAHECTVTEMLSGGEYERPYARLSHQTPAADDLFSRHQH